MADPSEALDPDTARHIDAALQRLTNSGDVDASLQQVLDTVLGFMRADMGTLQRLDDGADCLSIVASRGFSREVLSYFGVVRRDTNTTCAAAFTRRMRVFVENISTSYLFVGTPELDILRAGGVAAAHSTPLINSSGRLWGVVTTHFREPQIESNFDLTPLDRFTVQVADILERREVLMSHSHLMASRFQRARDQEPDDSGNTDADK